MKTRYILVAIFCCLVVNLFGQAGHKSLSISKLTGDFYVYTTYLKDFSSNSMYVVTNSGVVMFDTPWDTTQFQPLLDSIETRHHKKVILCIATHFHSDRTAGFGFLQQKGIKTWSSKQTFDLCREHNNRQAEYYFNNDTTFVIGNHTFQTYYPGEGHTKDNIVIWFDDEKILYGGCFVKSVVNNDLGYVDDANVPAWPNSIQNVMKKFPLHRFVIPGHFSWTSNDALEHTFDLLKRSK